MERHKVESSNMFSVGYDPHKQILEVEFKGGSVYQYKDCPPESFRALQEAQSKGSYFSKFIKSRFKYEKIKDGSGIVS